MNSFSYTIFIGLFLVFSLGLYFISNLLDLLKMTASHKLLVLKSGILFLALSPFAFFILCFTTTKNIEIKMPNLYIDASAAIPVLLPPVQQKMHWPWILCIGYSIGIFVVVIQLVRNYLMTQKWLSDSTEAHLLGQDVLLSSHISTPLSFGFFRPRIYFPKEAQQKWTSREIQMGLSHEQNHVLRMDPLWKLISLFVRSLLFFAPWMYAIHRKLELEMEILCDESTCIMTQSSIEEYGSLLLKLVCRTENRNLLITNITDSTIKRRIVSMKSRKIHRPIFATFLSSAIVFGGVAAMAVTSGVTEKKSVFKISSSIFINGQKISSPRLIVQANEKAEISQRSDSRNEELEMKLVASDVDMPNLKGGIGINFDIQYSFGEFKGHASPQVVLAPNEEGLIQVGDNNGQLFEIRIMAERK